MTLYVPPKDEHDALWAGECSGIEGATSVFGADEVSTDIFLNCTSTERLYLSYYDVNFALPR